MREGRREGYGHGGRRNEYPDSHLHFFSHHGAPDRCSAVRAVRCIMFVYRPASYAVMFELLITTVDPRL